MAKDESVAYIGIGSNLDSPESQINSAIHSINDHCSVDFLKVSGLYSSEPVGYQDQPRFLNAALKLTTCVSALELLDIMQLIEHQQRRVRTDNQNSPRTIDLDILLFGQLICSTPRLTIPHPRMLKRRFVLEPLLEISPSLTIPGAGEAVQFLEKVTQQDCHRISTILL